MIRLNLKREPEWLELLPGLRVLVDPATTALLEAARTDPTVEAMVRDGKPEEAVAVPFTKAVARLAIREWEGVGDEEGHPVPLSPENVDALLDVHLVYQAWHRLYTTRWAMLAAEKNASAPLPSGTSAGAPNTAQPVQGAAKPARRKSTSRKR